MGHERHRCGELRFDLIGHRQRGQEVLARKIGVLAGGEDRPRIVRGVAQPASGEIAIHEIDVSDERRIVERRIDGVGAATADQRAAAAWTAEFIGLRATRFDRWRAERIDGARHCVEDAHLESLAPLGSQVVVFRAQGKTCDAIDLAKARNDRLRFAPRNSFNLGHDPILLIVRTFGCAARTTDYVHRYPLSLAACAA